MLLFIYLHRFIYNVFNMHVLSRRRHWSMDASIVALELIRLFQMFNHFPYLIQSAGPSLNSQSVS